MNGTRWIEANGTVSRVALDGAGETMLVLVHEMGGTLESWSAVLPALSARRRVMRYDVRGAGLSQKVRGTLSIETLGEDLAALLDEVGAPRRVAVVGTAVGGAIALQFAAAFPDRCAAVIVSSPATGVPAEKRADSLARADDYETHGYMLNLDARLARTFPEVLRTDPAAFAQMRASRFTADPFGVAAATRMLAGLDMTERLGTIRCPALILAGEHDGERPPERVAPVAAAIPGAVYKVLPTGHFAAMATPGLLVREIEDFLAQHGAG